MLSRTSDAGITAGACPLLCSCAASCKKSICFNLLGPKPELKFALQKLRPEPRETGWFFG
jgi:hypothetical protein